MSRYGPSNAEQPGWPYLPRPREHKKKPQECSRCHVLYDGPTEHLIRNLYVAGWRVVFSDDGPTHMLCPECIKLHERNTRVTVE